MTHTLIGLIAGEAIVNHSRPGGQGLSSQLRRGVLLGVAVIGSNAPDLDLLYTYRGTSTSSLRYVLWHRGYTHTVVGCLALALLLYGGARAWLAWKDQRPSPRDCGLLLGTAVLATALHLGMDYLNSYGVHPFWPAENRWTYGDAVFIVEPLYWVAAAPLFFLLRSLTARVLFGAALTAAVVLGAVTHLVTATLCVMLATAILLALALGARITARSAARISAAAAFGVTLAFVLAGQIAARRAEALARSAFPGDRMLDHVLTPLPVNPICWDLLLLETHQDRYVARRATLALAPGLLGAAQCPTLAGPQHTAPLTPVVAPDTAAVHWLGEFAMPQADFIPLLAHNCDAAAFMRFARAPFLGAVGAVGDKTVPGGLFTAASTEVLGDLRFDRGPMGGGLEVRLESPDGTPADSSGIEPDGARPRCARAAPWTAPRADLLR